VDTPAVQELERRGVSIWGNPRAEDMMETNKTNDHSKEEPNENEFCKRTSGWKRPMNEPLSGVLFEALALHKFKAPKLGAVNFISQLIDIVHPSKNSATDLLGPLPGRR
jgi:hypothetical protein